MSIPQPTTGRDEVPPWRLLATLAGAGAVAGLLIVFVYRWTAPVIEANKARELDAAIEEVLKAPERYDTLYVVGGALAARAPEGVDPRTLERIYEGFGADHHRLGFAIAAGEPGFQDVVRLIFGYDPTTRQVLGMKVLESKETPGLGDKIQSDSGFISQFQGAAAPLVGVKTSQAARPDPHNVDMITGATISSRTVIRIINNALARLGPLIERYEEEPAR